MRAEVRGIIEKKPTHRQRAGHSRPSARTFRSRFSLFISASCASFSWSDPLARWPPFLRAEAALNISGIAKDRKSVVLGTSVSVRVDLGGRRIIKKKTHDELRKKTHTQHI